MTFLDHFYGLLQVPRFEASITFASKTVDGPSRKAMACRAHAMASEIFVPVETWEKARHVQVGPRRP
jgi:hypothetical protein